MKLKRTEATNKSTVLQMKVQTVFCMKLVIVYFDRAQIRDSKLGVLWMPFFERKLIVGIVQLNIF
jgi:hypothetical protein